MILYNTSFVIIRLTARFRAILDKMDPIAPSGKNAVWCFRWDFIVIEKRCNVFTKVHYTRVCTRKFQIQDIEVILHRPAGFERTFYSDFTRDLITGGIFIPHRFRTMFMEYPDNAGAAFWLNSTYYATVKRILHRYVPRGSFLSRNEYVQ